MIAEYERAQILERSRRGKRHRARQGEISVLSGAPYGYRYVRKSDDAAAYYEVIEAEAGVVRMVYECYTAQGVSIGAIARLLNERGRADAQADARAGSDRRSGRCCAIRPTGARPASARRRSRRGSASRARCGYAAASPRATAPSRAAAEEWIEIAVPAIVGEETFARAQELLEQNKIHAPRRTITPSIVQGLVAAANAATPCRAPRPDRARA